MRTRAKKKHVAGDRARRENVPGHILLYMLRIVLDKSQHICYNNQIVLLFLSRIKITGGTHEES